MKFIVDNPMLNDSTFHYSKVKYDYHAKIYEREQKNILGKYLSCDWLKDQLSSLNENWDLSFHSNIILPNKATAHIPLIDFSISKFDSMTTLIIDERLRIQDSLMKFLAIIKKIKIYSSGRSFHGYASHLLNDDEWREFTAAIILFNYTKELDEFSTIIDVRWIAHRLLEGFCSLRWSCNCCNYKQYPILLNDKSMVDDS